MIKRLLLLCAVASLAAAGAAADGARSAPAASTTVKITKTGYNPTAVSITAGDSVVFENDDTVAHTVDFKPATGIACSSPVPLVVAAGQSGSCRFSSTGNVKFSDPAQKSKGFRGTISVASPPDVSLTVSPKSAVYGRKVTLSGMLVNQQSGQSVQVMAQECGTTASATLATLTTGTGGAYTTQATPLKQTTYTVKYKSSTSLASTVAVQPLLRLRKTAKHRFALRVSAAQSFAGKHASFQRYNRKLEHWRGVKRVLLHASSKGVAPTVLTTAKFRSSIKAKVRVRVILEQAQVGSCYAAGKSNTTRS